MIARGLSLSVALLVLVACDGLVRVQGTIVSLSGEVISNDCVVDLYLAAGEKKLGRREVGAGDFLITFTVLPTERDYFVEITCPGYTMLRSPVFTRSGRMTAPHPLGEIELENASVESTAEDDLGGGAT
jgi:hypothetical protein